MPQTYATFFIPSGKRNTTAWLALLPVKCVSKDQFVELKDIRGTWMEHSAMKLTHSNISSTLNWISLHGTVWTWQFIQSQLTTLRLDMHLHTRLSHSDLAKWDFDCCFFTEHFFHEVKNFMSVQPCSIQVTVLGEGKLPMFAFCTKNNNVGSTNEEKEGCFHRKHVAYVPSENAKKLWLPALNLTGCCQNRSIANKSKEKFAKNTGRAAFSLHEWRTVGKWLVHSATWNNFIICAIWTSIQTSL